MKTLVEAVVLLGWAGLWALGGIWAVRSAFNLRLNEQGMVGVAVGFIVQNLLANMLARILPLMEAIWVAAAAMFLLGLALTISRRADWRELVRIPIRPAQWLVLAFLVGVFILIGRGLAIFDDYAHLPVVSMMAAGDIPPHFPLNPSVSYGYHYFLLLWAAQLMRIGSMYPWSALDLARAVTFGLAIVLMGLWTQRLTRSRLAGFLGAVMLAFGTGTRWLLLLLPPAVLQRVSGQVQLIGSGLQSGPDLISALTNAWTIEGGGPLAYPFAFVNGIIAPAVMAHGSAGMASAAVSFPLLLTFNRWRGWRGGLLTAFLIASTSLMTEKGVVFTLAAWAIVTLAYVLRTGQLRRLRSFSLPRSLWGWWAALLGGTVLGMLQGGALTSIISDWLDDFVGSSAAVSYQSVGFKLVFPPEIVSAHLGVLSFSNPAQMLAALAELGPLLLVLPLLAVWGWKALWVNRWYEAVSMVTVMLGLAMIFLEFTGSTGVRNTARLYGFLGAARLWAVVLGWIWLARRKEWLRVTAVALFVIVILGGMVLFGVELPAAQRPVRTYFVGDQDVLMERDYWNRLAPGALIFDRIPWRSPTLFARSTDSSLTWYSAKPAWEALLAQPSPQKLLAAGFRYAYLDTDYWDTLTPEIQQGMQAACVQVIKEYEDYRHDMRRLVDLNGCQ